MVSRSCVTLVELTAALDDPSVARVVLAAGTYALSAQILSITRGMTIEAASTAEPGSVVLDGSGSVLDGIMTINSPGGTVELVGLSFTGVVSYNDGGALHVARGHVHLTDCLLYGNEGHLGGAAYITGSLGGTQVQFTRCIIRSNHGWNGGAIAIEGGSVHFHDCELHGNSAGNWGGGLYISGGTVHLSDSNLYENLVTNEGGAIYVGTQQNDGTVLLERCTLVRNEALHAGGGLHAHSGPVALLDTAVQGNQAAHGGGLLVTNSQVALVHCAFVDNHAWWDGANALVLSSGSVCVWATNLTQSQGTIDACPSPPPSQPPQPPCRPPPPRPPPSPPPFPSPPLPLHPPPTGPPPPLAPMRPLPPTPRKVPMPPPPVPPWPLYPPQPPAPDAACFSPPPQTPSPVNSPVPPCPSPPPSSSHTMPTPPALAPLALGGSLDDDGTRMIVTAFRASGDMSDYDFTKQQSIQCAIASLATVGSTTIIDSVSDCSAVSLEIQSGSVVISLAIRVAPSQADAVAASLNERVFASSSGLQTFLITSGVPGITVDAIISPPSLVPLSTPPADGSADSQPSPIQQLQPHSAPQPPTPSSPRRTPRPPPWPPGRGGRLPPVVPPTGPWQPPPSDDYLLPIWLMPTLLSIALLVVASLLSLAHLRRRRRRRRGSYRGGSSRSPSTAREQTLSVDEANGVPVLDLPRPRSPSARPVYIVGNGRTRACTSQQTSSSTVVVERIEPAAIELTGQRAATGPGMLTVQAI